MIHFETIWNEAEQTSKKVELTRKQIFTQLKNSLDDLIYSTKKDEYEKHLGKILFELCSLCSYLEQEQGIEINSALALSNAINNEIANLLDPE